MHICSVEHSHVYVVAHMQLHVLQAWLALYLESFRALLPASWDDLALVSGWVLIF